MLAELGNAADGRRIGMDEPAVEVTPQGRLWVVKVIENGKLQEATFEVQSSAENFAAGQRIRLNLPPKPTAP